MFLELCGGIRLEKSDEDLAFVEALTGVPKQDIVPSLRLLDEFFAPDGGTMFYSIKGQLLCLKMVPGFVHGIGAILRHKVFAFDDYEAKYPEVGWLLWKWHNAAHDALKPVLGAP